MRNWQWALLFITFSNCSAPQSYNEKYSEADSLTYQPAVHLQNLFYDVQTSRLFADSKTFVDCRPKMHPQLIIQAYNHQKELEGFNLKNFVDEHFYLPEVVDSEFISNVELNLVEHLSNHWPHLTRPADDVLPYSSLIALPHSYVVPGGRFREIYYWDSYFTMHGLVVSDRLNQAEDMLNNFAWLIQEVGHIPNGNRTYYLTRSQPPFFGAMVSLYQKHKGTEAALAYLEALEAEYNFWMDGEAHIKEPFSAYRRLVHLENGDFLNRYYDDANDPRPESYEEDYELAEHLPEEDKVKLYRNIRAAAESGWDFSSRWMANAPDLSTTVATHIIPIDLNCLLYHTENLLAELYLASSNKVLAQTYQDKAQKRLKAINKYLWNNSTLWFEDYNWKTRELSGQNTLAAVSALYFGIASPEQAEAIAQQLADNYLLEGGLVTTLNKSGQQWDYPNGWAPLQWMAIKGLRHYGHKPLANEISERWLKLVKKVFSTTGRMMEKYNVADTTLAAGGGEYPLQDGFGWTNGVVLALILDGQ